MNSTFFSGRTFLVTRWSVEPLLKTADELIQTPDQPATPATR